MSLLIDKYIAGFSGIFVGQKDMLPWHITQHLIGVLQEFMRHLGADYVIRDGIAVHKTAVVEKSVVLKAPVIIGEGCFLGANAYLRGGVYLGTGTTIGTGCEVKTSIVLHHSAIAHFNFIGDSIIGSNVNFEAGSIIANHYNERENKRISVVAGTEVIDTQVEKFGALVGDNCRIGANAVLSPGTVLERGSIIKRLALVEQLPAG
ncbi:LpxA family transferase [Pontibacter sp. 172403-2]|uniref:DapH/DapD/GlmU-related protein n=1 Tax=Pontibacter rufus TaxID=2791028 RepID=UPI0018AF7ABA|nr:DapH/DapD/GlmU-related protein [Pontibacter sp. 172403-2]MBF9252307.1 LpxA family transferase [Pontibacter sp. 172403-2]